MDSQLSQDSQPPPEASIPLTPELPHATIPDSTTSSVSRIQSQRIENAARHMTPPPSTQAPWSQRPKTRTPTPTASHISTPPPTVEALPSSQSTRALRSLPEEMEADELETASPADLRAKVLDLRSALQEAKTAAAHHKLQYQMLSQESEAAIERMAVEARMAQYENEVIHSAEQARAAATPVQFSPLPEGMIPVQKELYQRMVRDVQNLTDDRNYLFSENAQKDKSMEEHELEIERLNDKIVLLREVVRENREQLHRYRRSSAAPESTPTSVYTSPLRHGVSRHEQPQPFAALLQASEMASSQEARRPVLAKKGHSRNTHSMTSIPTTPSRHSGKSSTNPFYTTPTNRQAPLQVPQTAPIPRTRTLQPSMDNVYGNAHLPVSSSRNAHNAPSEGTVSASEDEIEDDSEAETEILSPSVRQEAQANRVSASQASRSAAQMLRREDPFVQQRDSFVEKHHVFAPSGGAASAKKSAAASEKYKQTRLDTKVTKSKLVRARSDEDESAPAAKRQKSGEAQAAGEPRAVGLGIAGVRH